MTNQSELRGNCVLNIRSNEEQRTIADSKRNEVLAAILKSQELTWRHEI